MGGAEQQQNVVRYFRVPGVLPHHAKSILLKAQAALPDLGITGVETEHCFNVLIDSAEPLSDEAEERLLWLLKETYEPELTAKTSFLESASASTATAITSQFEVGPRMNFESAVSSNAKSICRAVGLEQVKRLEVSRRFLLSTSVAMSGSDRAAFLGLVHDRMTEMEYVAPLTTFSTGFVPEPVATIQVLERGKAALEEVNAKRGLGFDAWDLDFYLDLFRDKLKRNPTDVELFDMGQANSEHSRHWFFSGKMVLDGQEQPKRLFDLVKDTLPKGQPSNSVIAFHDNSSSIRGFPEGVQRLQPSEPGSACPLKLTTMQSNPILTAETHNFPSGVAPFPGAETGTGGRLRDVMATGQGAHAMAGISAYCVGNLLIPDYDLPWEQKEADALYAPNLASPLEIIVEASNGASDYGNKFGEPVVHGFSRSFGQRLPNGERMEYVKPIMFSAGIGQMDHNHSVKGEPEVGMWVVKVGGPAYRIGVGGGAASSRLGGDQETAALDFDAVQRGDAEMENRVNRLMRACVELGPDNPIVSVHDQGAGGNGNVLKEIVDPAGAVYDIRKLLIGDETMSVLEIWGAEYQENNALLLRPQHADLFRKMALRESCPVAFLGQVSGDGRVKVFDSRDNTTPYDLPLAQVLGDLPQKEFRDSSSAGVGQDLRPLELPPQLTVSDALERVLRLLHVGSKRFLTNKVDRSVSGLVAQQQCVGPLETPLANCAVLASSYEGLTGIVTACGEQPIKGLVNSAAMARLTLAEALTNAVWAKVTKLSDFKASGNWMWASKLPGECVKMWNACVALRQACLDTGVGIDGGKDSLSMAAKCGKELVKSPGTLVMTLYNTCPDITKTVTPDLKLPGREHGCLLYIDLGGGRSRTGGSSLAQAYGQVGDETPDVEDFKPLVAAFETTQTLLDSRSISAGHDRSDGGLLVTLLEMAFSGNVGFAVEVPALEGCSALETLFGEEAGLVIEVAAKDKEQVVKAYATAGVACLHVGHSTVDKTVSVRVGEEEVLTGVSMPKLRDVWEATSFQLMRRQTNPECVAQEEALLAGRKGSDYTLTFPLKASPVAVSGVSVPKVCVLRHEGSNGDREMCAAFHAAGLEAWDVNMNDLLSGAVSLNAFQGIAFVGGFSYADVLDSAKGWASAIKFSPAVLAQFEAFRQRKDTFSLGVCNGCQLMALLGWIPGTALAGADEKHQPRFIHNTSGRYESRWSTVQVQPSPAVLLKGMEGSSLGVWVAHGEGHLHFPDASVKETVQKEKLCPLKFVDEENAPTEVYPFNPNGSPGGMTALCSEDGRHLAMMPHPERCFASWQCPYLPAHMQDAANPAVGPWLKMFQNAKEWCESVAP